MLAITLATHLSVVEKAANAIRIKQIYLTNNIKLYVKLITNKFNAYNNSRF